MEYINTKITNQTPAFLITLIFIFFILAQGANAACTYNNSLVGEELPFGIVINWTTSEEFNNEMFIIEKSENGKDFTRIGSVKGSGTVKQTKKYSFMDVNAQQEVNFYRLMQIDFDGSSSYSDIVKIDRSLENKFSIVHLSSEVITDAIDLKLNSTESGVLDFEVKTSNGQLITKNRQQLILGTNNLSIDFSTFKSGIYKLHLNMGNEKEILVLRKIKSPEKPMASTTSNK